VKRFLTWAFARGLGTLDIQIHDNRILPASDDHSLARHVRVSIDFLMRDVWRNVNEIPGASLIAELQLIAPAHARPAPNDVKHRFQLAVVVSAGFGIWLHDYSSGP
jgi:hypothetical protein